MTYWFLATPYSKFPHGLEAAYRLACRARALLMKAGVAVFSPIAHSHGVALHGDIDPLDHAIWLPAEAPMRRAACGLIALRAQGWEDSYGMAQEIAEFRERGLPVIYMDPGEVPPEFLAKAAAE